MRPQSKVVACLVGAAILMAVTSPTASVAVNQPSAAKPGGGDERHVMALERLRDDAGGGLRVNRDRGGHVELVRSLSGDAIVPAAEAAAGPARAARAYLDRYGAVFGVGGGRSAAAVVDVTASQTGGTVVRAHQRVAGLPVFGGQVVVSLDEEGGLVSASAATTPSTPVAVPRVTETSAARTARAVTAKAHSVPASTLEVQPSGRWLYDPALVHVSDPLGQRPVWRFEVSNGSDVRELVLVDTARGSVALHYNQTAALNRVVCDSVNSTTTTGHPACTTPVRTETSGPTGQPQVEAAFDHTGATADFYQQVAGLDLTELVGAGASGSRRLASIVRWCYYGDTCPMPNAFWDGTQMVYGDGFASADDVVAHELTHGVIDHTSQLFYLHQSGAIHESLADVIGELVDQRTARVGEDDSAWLLGEDAPGGAIRSLADPTAFGQPDRMSSSHYATGSINEDSGEVHINDGVGNKAAYLISQGGTFNGVTVAGVDRGDPTLAQSATLYTEVIQRLTSGSEYADLARTLILTCDELAAAGSAGFTAADCASVRAAVRATEMTAPPADPAAAAAEAPDSCPPGTYKQTLYRDDDDVSTNPWNVGALWTRAPRTDWGVPGYASSGSSSWFGYDPDPAGYGDPYSSGLWSTTDVTVPTGQPTYLHFHHAHVFEWYDATQATPARYPDGGQVSVLTLRDYGDGNPFWAATPTPLEWVNGPQQPITSSSTGSTWTGFGGDSHGYGSSRVDLTPLTGQTVRPKWTVIGDASGSFLGWWIDDIEIYTCPSAIPTAPRNLTATGTNEGVTLRWATPSYAGSGITGYRITRSDGTARRVSATSRQATFTSLPANRSTTFTVSALNTDRTAGATASTNVVPTDLSIRPSTSRIAARKSFTIRGQLLRAGTTTGIGGKTLQLHRRIPGAKRWSALATGTTRRDGTIRWTRTQRRTYDYRITFPGHTGWMGTRSQIARVRIP